MDLSRYPVERHGLLHSLDGRVKTVVLLLAIAVAAALQNVTLTTGLWIGATGLFCFVRQGWWELARRLLMPLGIAWVVFVSLMLTQGHHPVWHRCVAGLTLHVYQEGLALGLLLLTRIMAAVTLAAVLSFSTPMVEILATLRLCKVPETLVDLADMMFRYVFLLSDTAQTMRRAQLSRLGGEASWSRRVGDTGRMASSIVIESLNRSIRIYKAMLSRGYSEHTPVLSHFKSPIPRRDQRLGWTGAVLLLLLLFTNAWMSLRHASRDHQPVRSLLHLS